MHETSKDEISVDGGPTRKVLAYNGKIPGPPIVICEGDFLIVNLTNGITDTEDPVFEDVTTLHFHGITEKNRPWGDGVPWITQCPMLFNTSFEYGFYAKDFFGAPPGTYAQSGTYWYHSHVSKQRTHGAYGALIIRPNSTESESKRRFKHDSFKNTIILQEWYEQPDNIKIQSLLINGNGKADASSATNYHVFEVNSTESYIFRIIGAISNDIPLRLSIEDHKFMAIAADGQDIQSVEDLDYLWVAGGERFDIVVKNIKADKPYKIKVFGYENPNLENSEKPSKVPYCTIAWLTHTRHNIDISYFADCHSSEFMQSTNSRTLNPIPMNYTAWKERKKYGNIFFDDIKAMNPENSLTFMNGTIQSSLLNTQYTELIDLTFNNNIFQFPDVPLLLQDPQINETRCGTVCNFNVQPDITAEEAMKEPYVQTNCVSYHPDSNVKKLCQQVLQQPYAPGYWYEIVLINNDVNAHAHPIHQHGGWYWVVGMGKYDFSINATWIEYEDTRCEKFNATTQVRCLPRNFDMPVAKDTIQVPPGGYVIMRTSLKNKGVWFFHCHINNHVNAGMAMALQIGSIEPAKWKKRLIQNWCTGVLDKTHKCQAAPPKM